MPNLLDSCESDASSSKESEHKQKLTSPSPAPSEPCFSMKSASQALTGPPKPPRDPNRLSSIDIHQRLPASSSSLAMRNIAGSTTSLPAFLNRKNVPKDTEFIWKAPPAPFVSQSSIHEHRLTQPPNFSRGNFAQGSSNQNEV